MGTAFAPSYANLGMGYLESKRYKEVDKNVGHCFKENIIKIGSATSNTAYVFGSDQRKSYRTFQNTINTLHPYIKFTTETIYNELPLLDIHIKINNSTVTQDIFYKKTDTHQYLNFYSCYIKRNMHYNKARRMCTIDNKS